MMQDINQDILTKTNAILQVTNNSEIDQPGLLESLRKNESKIVDANGKEEFAHHSITVFLTTVATNDISKLSKEKARIFVDVVSSALISLEKSNAISLLQYRNPHVSNIFILTTLCTKAEYFDPLSRLEKHLGSNILSYCNSPKSVVTDWKNAIQSPQDLINKYVKDKYAEFSVNKFLRFMAYAAGGALLLYGNVAPKLKPEYRFNGLIVCLGLTTIATGIYTHFFSKPDPASLGVSNELLTAR